MFTQTYTDINDEEEEEMYINIRTLLRMTNEQMTDPTRYFLRSGIRVFEDDDGECSIMKNAAILYVSYDCNRVYAVNDYKPEDKYEAKIRHILLGSMDEGFDVLKEVKK